MSSAAPSRAVSAVNPKRTSINFNIDVKSRVVCETKLGFEYGETTHSGRRKPDWSKFALMSVVFHIGGIASGFGIAAGTTWSKTPPPSSKVSRNAEEAHVGLFISASMI